MAADNNSLDVFGGGLGAHEWLLSPDPTSDFFWQLVAKRGRVARHDVAGNADRFFGLP